MPQAKGGAAGGSPSLQCGARVRFDVFRTSYDTVMPCSCLALLAALQALKDLDVSLRKGGMARLLRVLALAACAASAACAALHPPHNASDCPALRTEHVHRFEHACLLGGAEPPHTGLLLCLDVLLCRN